jgi:hypothetical protein
VSNFIGAVTININITFSDIEVFIISAQWYDNFQYYKIPFFYFSVFKLASLSTFMNSLIK